MRICRTLGTAKLRNLDPFLMLDELRMPAREASAGFPDHPHRGFETCSIMLSGKMEHNDSVGNQVSMLAMLQSDCRNTMNSMETETDQDRSEPLLNGLIVWVREGKE